MFTLRRKGKHGLQLERVLQKGGEHEVTLYLFTPHDRGALERALGGTKAVPDRWRHGFRMLGLPAEDKASLADTSISLLSPHYEVLCGTWLSRYQASIDHLRQRFEDSDNSEEIVKRALKLSENLARRLRQFPPESKAQLSYFRRMDIYFSWYSEQFFLECASKPQFSNLGEPYSGRVRAYLAAERQYRERQGYLADFRGSPTQVWHRMALYHKLLEHSVVTKTRTTDLWRATYRAVKALYTMVIMTLFTVLIFHTIRAVHRLTITLLIMIALIHALRDYLHDEMVNRITGWLLKGRPLERTQILKPLTEERMGAQLTWFDYLPQAGLPSKVRRNAGRGQIGEEMQTVLYRARLMLEPKALDQGHVQEVVGLDLGPLCELVEGGQKRLYSGKIGEVMQDGVQAHDIERQHIYTLLVVCAGPGDPETRAQRWRVTLSGSGITQCESREADWPAAGG
ncbi:hypothetical protein [Thioalkalivibrio sp. ALRh]|uniref:hypothetical protein n=1 Tax=Thioalkalivibrio sp. ALRh TaxID=1266911 RepID=UPI0003A31689|nr:hypothetical protein [Thioalkalivibrio sp. ALRh]